MPVKWTPANVQMLLWLAWGNCKYEAKDVADAWPTIPGEETPTKRAIQEKIGGIRKGVRDYGVASFFGNGTFIPSKSKKRINEPNQQQALLTSANDFDSKSTATANGLQYAAGSGTTAIKEEVPSTNIEPQEVDEAVMVATEATKHNKQYLSTPPKTPGRGRPSAAAKPNTRKRRRSDADTGSDSASMTTETTQSEISITPPNFDMKLRPDHRNINLHESDGEAYGAGSDGSDGSDAAWAPGVEEGRGRRKRVRCH